MRLEQSSVPKLLNLNETRQLLVCAVDDNLMGEITHTIKATDIY
jgi:hypothetical protein